jgi:hypothetical protein
MQVEQPAALLVGQTVSDGDGCFGTVAFVGQLAGKKGDWVGIVWNSAFPLRGKSDGSVDGNSYFTVEEGRSASFLKSHKVNACAAFVDEFFERYQLDGGAEAAGPAASSAGSAIQSVGAVLRANNSWGSSEHNNFFARTLKERTSLLMEDCGIYTYSQDSRRDDTLGSSEGEGEGEGEGAGGSKTDLIRQMCPAVQQLSLARNCLHDWASVRHVLTALPAITDLNLMHNLNLGEVQPSISLSLFALNSPPSTPSLPTPQVTSQ